MSRHTPGPWRRNKLRPLLIQSRHNNIASLGPYKVDEYGLPPTLNVSETEANATLMMASPDLLAAITFVLKMFKTNVQWQKEDELTKQTVKILREAMARAIGGKE